MHGEEYVNISPPPPLVPLSVMQMNFDSPSQIVLVISNITNLPNLPLLDGLSHFFFWACKSKKEGQSYFLDISVMANFTEWTTENDVNFT